MVKKFNSENLYELFSCLVWCAFLSFHFPTDAHMSYLTFVLVPSRDIVVLFGSSCHYYTKIMPFSEPNRKRKIHIMLMVKTVF